MTLSVEIVRLMILFVPGFIGIITLSNLTRYKEKPAHIFLFEVTGFSIFSYFFYFLTYQLILLIETLTKFDLTRWSGPVEILKVSGKEAISFYSIEILGTTAIALTVKSREVPHL